MSSYPYVYSGSFVKPSPAPPDSDGRIGCQGEIRKTLSRGPQRPDSLAKRARADLTDLETRAEVAIAFSNRERRLSSNCDAALTKIQQIHARSPQRAVPAARGEPAFQSRSVTAMKVAHAHAVPVTRSGLPDLERTAALGRVKVDVSSLVRNNLRKTPSGDQWRQMTPQQRVAWARKGLPPQDTDSADTSGIADTRASNNWRDQTDMGDVRTTRIGNQMVGVPNQSDLRAAELAAIKRDLSRRPRNSLGGPLEVGEAAYDEDGNPEDDDDQATGDPSEGDNTNHLDGDSPLPPMYRRKRRADEGEG